ncbi:hypothetical protein ACQ86N_19380 [Puia sp. P3]|uniref:hypothetical protein n=1 Tax=Puia sp. P3 TaxID=3423952 RepID=UPI003D6752B7
MPQPLYHPPDSDMILGGTPNAWLQDAVKLLNSHPDYLFVNPLAGPPAADFQLKQPYFQRLGSCQFVFQKMSTRVFPGRQGKAIGYSPAEDRQVPQKMEMVL